MIVQLPTPVSDTRLPLTVQLPAALKLTASPEGLAVALTVKSGSPYHLSGKTPNVIVWSYFRTAGSEGGLLRGVVDSLSAATVVVTKYTASATGLVTVNVVGGGSPDTVPTSTGVAGAHAVIDVRTRTPRRSSAAPNQSADRPGDRSLRDLARRTHDGVGGFIGHLLHDTAATHLQRAAAPQGERTATAQGERAAAAQGERAAAAQGKGAAAAHGEACRRCPW